MMQQLVQLLGFGLNDQTFDSLQGQRFFFVRCVSCGGGHGDYCLI